MERLSDNAIEILNELHTEHLAYYGEYIPLIKAAQKLKSYEEAEEQGRLISLNREIALAIAAGWRAIRTTKRFQGATYVYDPFGKAGGPYEISYNQASEILCNIWDNYPLHRKEAEKALEGMG